MVVPKYFQKQVLLKKNEYFHQNDLTSNWGRFYFSKDGHHNISHPPSSWYSEKVTLFPPSSVVDVPSSWNWADLCDCLHQCSTVASGVIRLPKVGHKNAMDFCLVLWGHLLLEPNHYVRKPGWLTEATGRCLSQQPQLKFQLSANISC